MNAGACPPRAEPQGSWKLKEVIEKEGEDLEA
jgi:hypothetical protein